MARYELDESDSCLPFTFDLSESSLIVISHGSELIKASAICEKATIVGIDTETKPCFYNHSNRYNRGRSNPSGGKSSKNRTALLQIAIRQASGNEHVLLFDLLSLIKPDQSSNSSKFLDKMLTTMLSNRKVIKIGQGLDDDFRELRDNYPHMNCFKSIPSILETNTIHRLLCPEDVQLKSLKNMVRIYLHFNLIKTQQLSNWSQRPLTKLQIHYAACDALVLLRLYDVMTHEAKSLFQKLDSRKPFEVQNILLDFPTCLETHKTGIMKKIRSPDGDSSVESPRKRAVVETSSSISTSSRVVMKHYGVSDETDDCDIEINIASNTIVSNIHTYSKTQSKGDAITHKSERNSGKSLKRQLDDADRNHEVPVNTMKSSIIRPHMRNNNVVTRDEIMIKRQKTDTCKKERINTSRIVTKSWRPIHRILGDQNPIVIGRVAEDFIRSESTRTVVRTLIVK